MTGMQLYWLLKLDDFRDLLDCISLAGAIIGGLGLFVILMLRITIANDDEKVAKGCARAIRPACIVIGITIFLALLRTILPSTKQLAVIYVVPPIINNESVQKIPGKMLNLAEEWLDELKPKKDGAKTKPNSAEPKAGKE